MIKNYHVQAIVLKRKNIGETDKILTVYSRKHGKISVIAKGIRRIQSKKAPYVEIFSNVHLYLACGKTFDIVTDVQPIQSFSQIRKNIDTVAYAYRFVEQVYRLTAERLVNDQIYHLLLNFLHTLNRDMAFDLNAISEQFTLALLKELGYLSDNPVLAGRDLDEYFEQVIERSLISNNLIMKVI